MTARAVRYSPDVETISADEGATVEDLNASFTKIMETTSEDYGHAVRGVHAKAHGIVRGRLTVAGDLPPELAQGMFATPGEHEAILRISTNPGDIIDDAIGLPRGLALKVLRVGGERLPGSEGESVQDFLMVNAPTFTATDPKAFAKNLKLLAATTDRAEGAKKLMSKGLRAVEATLEAAGTQSATLISLGGAKQVHPLGAGYYSTTPFRYGDHIVKYGLFPTAPALTALANEIVETKGENDPLRAAVGNVLGKHGGGWDLRVQLNTDLDAMPIEDPTVAWDEGESPYVTVATLTVEPQSSWAEGESEATDDALAFSPWNGLEAHRPLGGINRVRRATYAHSARFRGRFNGCPIHQPTALSDLPGVADAD